MNADDNNHLYDNAFVTLGMGAGNGGDGGAEPTPIAGQDSHVRNYLVPGF